MKPAQEVRRDGQADLFQQSCTASGVQIGTRWEIRCGGVCQILIGKLPTTGTRCDTAANAVSDRLARSLHGSPGLLGGPAERLAPSQPAPAEPRTGTNSSGAPAPDL